jgi:hypothetical protein
MIRLIAALIVPAAAASYAVIGASRITTGGKKPAEAHMAGTARAFLATLKPDQAAKASFPFNSDERLNWHYIPRARKGLPFKDLSTDQQQAAANLLHAGLSQKGFHKVATIRSLENVLKVMEQGKGPVRDPEMYFLSVFGEPSDSGTWGWRLEGHHVSLNWTIIKGKAIASTPQFLGSNPAEVREGPMKGTRVLAAEEDLGRALLNSLTADERKEAIISDKAPSDILTNNQRVAAIQEDKGVAFHKLTKDQQGMLIALIREYAGTQPDELAKKRLDAVRKAGLNQLKFAWMGGMNRGEGHYYRVQGPTFVIEYDNTQNDANHIHAVWRDFKGDWGNDLLAQHYREYPHGSKVSVGATANHH